jgi:uncharacterized protein DUF1554
MRCRAILLLALSISACSVYDNSIVNSSSAGAAGDNRIGASSGTTIGTGGAGFAITAGVGVGVGGTGGSGGGPERGGASSGGGGSIDATGSGGSAMGTGGREAGSPDAEAHAESGIEAGSSIGTDATPVDAPPDVVEGGSLCGSGTCKRVFLSSGAPQPSGRLGGVAAGDIYCQTVADAEHLGGTWRAWLSDTSSSPSTRFRRATVPYRLLDGTAIANDWTSLVSGALQHAIDVDEGSGVLLSRSNFKVWTGTSPNGTYSGEACGDWTSDSAGTTGDVGLTSQSNGQWTNAQQAFCNETGLRVYCFEQ